VFAISYKDEEHNQLQIVVCRSDDKSLWSFMKYRKYSSRHNSLESIIRREHLSIKKHCTRNDGILLDSGYYDTDTMGWATEMLERIQNSKVKDGYKENGILCKRYKEIPAGIENICIRIPTIWPIMSKDIPRI
jgi:hypothetical protein